MTKRVALMMGISLAFAASAGAQQPGKAAPTFTKDVAPILYKTCTTCHRPGEVAPMSLITYWTFARGARRSSRRSSRARCRPGAPTPRRA